MHGGHGRHRRCRRSRGSSPNSRAGARPAASKDVTAVDPHPVVVQYHTADPQAVGISNEAVANGDAVVIDGEPPEVEATGWSIAPVQRVEAPPLATVVGSPVRRVATPPLATMVRPWVRHGCIRVCRVRVAAVVKRRLPSSRHPRWSIPRQRCLLQGDGHSSRAKEALVPCPHGLLHVRCFLHAWRAELVQLRLDRRPLPSSNISGTLLTPCTPCTPRTPRRPDIIIHIKALGSELTLDDSLVALRYVVWHQVIQKRLPILWPDISMGPCLLVREVIWRAIGSDENGVDDVFHRPTGWWYWP